MCDLLATRTLHDRQSANCQRSHDGVTSYGTWQLSVWSKTASCRDSSVTDDRGVWPPDTRQDTTKSRTWSTHGRTGHIGSNDHCGHQPANRREKANLAVRRGARGQAPLCSWIRTFSRGSPHRTYSRTTTLHCANLFLTVTLAFPERLLRFSHEWKQEWMSTMHAYLMAWWLINALLAGGLPKTEKRFLFFISSDLRCYPICGPKMRLVCPFSHSSPDVEEVYVNWSTGDSQIELGDFCVMTMPEMGVRRTC